MFSKNRYVILNGCWSDKNDLKMGVHLIKPLHDGSLSFVIVSDCNNDKDLSLMVRKLPDYNDQKALYYNDQKA